MTDKKLTTINQSTLEALEEIDATKIIERFTNTAKEILSADFGFMFWKLENQDKYQIAYVSPETPYKPKLPRKKGYNYKASVGRIPYFISNPKRDLLPFMKSLVIIPIFYKNHQYGNIVICYKEKRVFTEAERSLTMALGNSAAQVLTIHRSHKKAERDYVKLIKQKDEFFNIASHELKTPVTTIKGFTQILGEIIGKDVNKAKYYLEKINRQSDKLSRLISDLLDISRIENGKLIFEKKTFELEELIEHTVEGLRVAIGAHPLSFKSDAKFWVRGDSHRVEEVLINLITNAAKYSPPKTKIVVALYKKDNMAVVEVEDFGYGISEKDKQKVFNRFFQSKNEHTKNLSGLGLGLYIANSIVKHHGGTLNFTTKTESSGTIFYFTLPYFKCKINKRTLQK